LTTNNEDRPIDVALQVLLDEAAIKKVQLRYCRGIDRMDWDLVRSCYHPDAIDDHGEYVGGIDGFIEYAKQGCPTFLSTTHFTGNQLVEVDGDIAWAEHYAQGFHRVEGEDGALKDLFVNVRFADRFERRGGEWRIAHRVVVVDTDRAYPVAERWVPKVQLRSARNKTDPTYSRNE
jgi:ketosteroid isomerase-like protein